MALSLHSSLPAILTVYRLKNNYLYLGVGPGEAVVYELLLREHEGAHDRVEHVLVDVLVGQPHRFLDTPGPNSPGLTSQNLKQ